MADKKNPAVALKAPLMVLQKDAINPSNAELVFTKTTLCPNLEKFDSTITTALNKPAEHIVNQNIVHQRSSEFLASETCQKGDNDPNIKFINADVSIKSVDDSHVFSGKALCFDPSKNLVIPATFSGKTQDPSIESMLRFINSNCKEVLAPAPTPKTTPKAPGKGMV